MSALQQNQRRGEDRTSRRISTRYADSGNDSVQREYRFERITARKVQHSGAHSIPNVKVERHGWQCSDCGCYGETVTTTLTTRKTFTAIVFRDHDLKSTCRTTSLKVCALPSDYNWDVYRIDAVIEPEGHS